MNNLFCSKTVVTFLRRNTIIELSQIICYICYVENYHNNRSSVTSRAVSFYRRNIMTSGNEADVGLVTEVTKATQTFSPNELLTLYKIHVTLCCWRLRYGKKIGIKVEATTLLL